ncbi:MULTISPECIES: hypothetical protein [Mesorhizobium]|uniref:hypothetical protein n=1 Tax=Mesorhizobium TaxID=68287 RepID=UPI0013FD327D|nr:MULTISPECIES: hypothetical protein [Mesorhizobium]MCF6115226.1 hypothetical protein [Mesorhizobium muleiense]
MSRLATYDTAFIITPQGREPVNLFAKLKDCWRIVTRYMRPHLRLGYLHRSPS